MIDRESVRPTPLTAAERSWHRKMASDRLEDVMIRAEGYEQIERVTLETGNTLDRVSIMRIQDSELYEASVETEYGDGPSTFLSRFIVRRCVMYSGIPDDVVSNTYNVAITDSLIVPSTVESVMAYSFADSRSEFRKSRPMAIDDFTRLDQQLIEFETYLDEQIDATQ